MKLPKKIAKGIAESESSGGSFDPLPEGKYNATVREITLGEGAKGPYWKFEFEIQDDEYEGRRQWTNMSLSDKAFWKAKEILGALGVDADDKEALADLDSDELVGLPVVLYVKQVTIQKGTRKGEKGNQVESIMSPDAAPSKGKGKAESDDDEDDEELF